MTLQSWPYDFCFIWNPDKNEQVCRQYVKAREYLRFITKAIVANHSEILFSEHDWQATNNIVNYLPNGAREGYLQMVDISNLEKLRTTYVLVLELLAHDACVDSVLPLKIAHECIHVVELTLLNMTDVDTINYFTLKLKYFCS